MINIMVSDVKVKKTSRFGLNWIKQKVLKSMFLEKFPNWSFLRQKKSANKKITESIWPKLIMTK
jgi:predicted NUDIX family phosphoesterase